jgi:hypothetical protein
MSYPDASGMSNFTALAGILKEYYGAQQIKNLVYKRNKLLAMVSKEEDWSGLLVPIPVLYGNPQGASATFATAQTNVTSSKAIRFAMNWAQDYAVAKITNLVQLASRNDAGAFLKAVRNELDGALKTAENRLAGGLFRSSTGTIGTGTIASGVITLTNASDVTQFEVGQAIEAASTDGGAALGSNVGYVIAVDRSAGKFSVATTQGGTAATPSSWTGTMHFRVQGDLNLKINGLADWFPTTAPTTGDSFNGVDRSVDPTRLAGVRWDGSSQTIEEAIIDAAALAAREDGNPELGITNHNTWAALVKALGSKVNYVNFESDEVPGIGFQGVRVNGPDGEINVFADRSCQAKKLYLLDPDTLTLGSMKPCPHILSELDGLEQLRASTADAAEVRIGSYAILACNAPGHSAVLTTQA